MAISRKIAWILGLAILAILGYRLADAKLKGHTENYEIKFKMPEGWRELPKDPSTLVLMRHNRSNALIRCSQAQVVSDTNPEPDLNSESIVDRYVEAATEKQPEWKTRKLRNYNNGRVEFGLFEKRNDQKTIVIAMAVRGNTTVVVSISNTGRGAIDLANDHQLLLTFLDTFDLTESDKWIKIHEKY